MRIEQLQGMAVVSVQEAERLGRVEDVYIDVQAHRVVALLLQGGLFRGGPVVPWSEVRTLGEDAVMVDTRSATDSGVEVSGVRFTSLRGTKVVTDAGALAGTLTSAEIDPTSGQVTSYVLVAPEGGSLFHAAPQFRLPASAVVAVGMDLITVAAGAIASAQADT